MTLNQYINFLGIIKDKNDNYIERFMIAYTLKISLEEVDTLSAEKYQEGYTKSLSIFAYNNTELLYKSFDYNGITYNVLQEEDLLVSHYFLYESFIKVTQEYQFLVKPILRLMTNSTDKDDFDNLPHDIAMNIVSFFLSILRRLRSDTQQYLTQIQTHQNLIKEANLNNELTKFSADFINLFISLPIRTFLNLSN